MKNLALLIISSLVLGFSLVANSDQPEREKEAKEQVEIKLFVMSGCPFGQQAEKAIEPVINKFGDNLSFNPHYIILPRYGKSTNCLDSRRRYCSMHGRAEAAEDVRQICLWNQEQEKWWDYIAQFNQSCNPNNPTTNPGVCSKGIIESLGIDYTEIQNCSGDYETLLEKEIELSKIYRARSSPTLIIAGQKYLGDGSPEALSSFICSKFINKPAICEQ